MEKKDIYRNLLSSETDLIKNLEEYLNNISDAPSKQDYHLDEAGDYYRHLKQYEDEIFAEITNIIRNHQKNIFKRDTDQDLRDLTRAIFKSTEKDVLKIMSEFFGDVLAWRYIYYPLTEEFKKHQYYGLSSDTSAIITSYLTSN